MDQGIPFWDAVYHENINEVELVVAAVGGGTGVALSAVALPAVPTVVSGLGLTGASGGAATIVGSAAVGGTANVAGEFAGRLWENSMYYALGESTRTDLWDASYANDFVWGAVAGGVDGAFRVTSQFAMSRVQTRAASELRTQAACELWDLSLEQGSWHPFTRSAYAYNEGLRLYLQMELGPAPALLQQTTAGQAAAWHMAGDVLEVVVQDEALETLFPVVR